jgi:hypothetical protein
MLTGATFSYFWESLAASHYQGDYPINFIGSNFIFVENEHSEKYRTMSFCLPS